MRCCHSHVLRALIVGALSPIQAQACTPTPLPAGSHGPDLCWGARSWNEPSLGGQRMQQTFDYYPSRSSLRAPLIIYFHPNGSNSHIAPGSVLDRTLLQPALDAGYAFATVEFRHPVVDDSIANAPGDSRVPHWDVARATQFIRSNANALGFDKRNVYFVGYSRGTLSIWTALQDDMADPQSPDPVARESTRVRAIFAYQAQTTYRDTEFSKLFLVPRDRASYDAQWENDHPKFAQFGSAISSVKADAPPIKIRYEGAYVGHLVTLEEMDANYDQLHYPDFGPALCAAYAKAGAKSDCVVEFERAFNEAFEGYLEFFADHQSP